MDWNGTHAIKYFWEFARAYIIFTRKNIYTHMDLKPANILINDQIVPKITYFGLARFNVSVFHITDE